tara:strand:+ start:6871 stop:7659 length:789 start_codon:yes stop_codon:yes gene_type:complete
MDSKHLGELKTFFRKNNKEIRKQHALKGNSPKKILKLVIKDNAFTLVDPITKTEQEVQSRIPTYDVYEELKRIEEEQHDLSHDLLHRKYAFLFEYKSMEMYLSDLELYIEPKELEYQDLEKEKKKFKQMIEQRQTKYKEELESIKVAQKVFITQLKDMGSSVDPIEKKGLMKEYILLQKEWLNKRNKQDEIMEYLKTALKVRNKTPRDQPQANEALEEPPEPVFSPSSYLTPKPRRKDEDVIELPQEEEKEVKEETEQQEEK